MAGFTTVRDLGDNGVNSIALRKAIEQGWVPGPRIFTSGRALATTGGHADPTNALRGDYRRDTGPLEGVINGADDAQGGATAIQRRRGPDQADRHRRRAQPRGQRTESAVHRRRTACGRGHGQGLRHDGRRPRTRHRGHSARSAGRSRLDRARHLHDRRGDRLNETQRHLLGANQSRRRVGCRKGEGARIFSRNRSPESGSHWPGDPAPLLPRPKPRASRSPSAPTRACRRTAKTPANSS